MKYCSECGNQMEDDMRFCQKCGTAFEVKIIQPIYIQHVEKESQISNTVNKKNTERPGLRVFGWLFLAFTVISLIMYSFEPLVVTNIIVFPTASILCFLLSGTPKGNMSGYIFFKGKPLIKRKPIITLIIFVSFFLCMIAMLVTFDKRDLNKETQNTQSQNATTPQTQTVTNPPVTKKDTIADVQNWFNKNKNSVSDNFVSFLGTQTLNSTKLGSNLSISNTKVSKIEFKFDKDLGCYYVLYFDCIVGGQYKCSGHSRGFLEYKGTSVTWWSLEIDFGSTALIDNYSDEYDKIVFDYYNNLVQQYN